MAGLNRGGRHTALCLAVSMAVAVGPGPVGAGEAGKPGPVGAGEAGKPGPDIEFVDEAAPDDGTPPSSPFGPARGGPTRADAVPGCVELSNGLRVPGHIYTTRAKRLKVYNLSRKIYEYVPVPACREIEAVLEWERLDKQWRFKEAGSPEKVYTGKSYPVRMLAWRLTLRNGHEIVGHILGEPIYVEHNHRRERFILHKRQKGPLGGDLEGLVYVRRVRFGPRAYNEAVEELGRKAGEAAANEHE